MGEKAAVYMADAASAPPIPLQAFMPSAALVKQLPEEIVRVRGAVPFGRLGDTLTKVVDATALGKSVSFPKCSTDGRYILMTVSDYGTFPIWHGETDLWLYEIATGTLSPLETVNGKYSDSYHCWSSTGRWICWASKRDDRLYGKPYFSHVGDDGTLSKPFVLPQRDPGRYLVTLKSYNIPELYRLPESYDAAYVSRFYSDMEAEKMTYTK